MDMCFRHLSFSMPENSLLRAGVRAMGLKLLGECGSPCAELFATSLNTASFHPDGITPVDKMLLKRSKRAGRSEGQRLNIVYGIWSIGDGDDDALDLRIAAVNSSNVIESRVIGWRGIAGVGIHAGLLNR